MRRERKSENPVRLFREPALPGAKPLANHESYRMTLLWGASPENKSSHSDLVDHEVLPFRRGFLVSSTVAFKQLGILGTKDRNMAGSNTLLQLTKCTVLCIDTALPLWPNVQKAFTDHGFGNWKKALETLRAHETCQSHLTAMTGAISGPEKIKYIIILLDEQQAATLSVRQKQIQENRQILTRCNCLSCSPEYCFSWT